MTDTLEFLTARLAEDEAAVEPLRWAIAVWNDYDGELSASGEYPVMEISPSRVLAEVAAKRALIAAVTAEHHLYNDADGWYSCSQAVGDAWQRDQDPEYSIPGSGCIDDRRAGQPCDCGRDERIRTHLRIMAQVYAGHAEFKPAWAL